MEFMQRHQLCAANLKNIELWRNAMCSFDNLNTNITIMSMDGQNTHHVAVVASQHGCVDKGQIHSSH